MIAWANDISKSRHIDLKIDTVETVRTAMGLKNYNHSSSPSARQSGLRDREAAEDELVAVPRQSSTNIHAR